MRRISLAIVLAVWAGASFGQSELTQSTFVYKSTQCPFSIPSGERAECGYLTVPENRSKNSEGKITLFVTVVKSYSRTPKTDPIVFLSGIEGGASSAQLAQGEYWDSFARFRQDRDMIFVDQRGTGNSQPNLFCRSLPSSNVLSKQDYLLKLRGCRDRLLKKKIDLTAFNSKESARDIIDLMRAKGYKRCNILAGAYSSRVALAVAGLSPQLVRSVVLNSAVPLMPSPDFAVSMQANNQRVFEQFFYDCGVDSRCRKAFPNLKDMYLQLIRSLPNKIIPGKISVSYAVTTLATELSHDDAIYYLPQHIYQLAQANLKGQLTLEQFDRIIGSSSSKVEHQLAYSIPYFCYDLGEFVSKLKAPPANQSPYFSSANFQACDVWGRGYSLKFFKELAHPTIPVLVLAGEYDTTVPAQWSRRVAKPLPNAKLFQFKGVGHNVIDSLPCALYMTAAFFDRPDHKPEDACLMALKPPSFFVPDKQQETSVVVRAHSE